MTRLRRLVSEVHRRSLWQVLSIYLLGSWVGYQVVVEVTDGVGLPSWVPGFAIVLFVIGLPIVLATAFIQEGAPAFRARHAEPFDLASVDLTLLPEDAASPEMQKLATSSPPQPGRGRHHFFFTWQKALLGGVIAFLLLGVTAGGYIGMRNAGIGPFGSLLARGELEKRERLVIADFNSPTGDSALAAAVTAAFRVDFAQTPVVTVIEPAYVRAVLQRMSRDPKSKLDADLAREVAIRDNIKVYLEGEFSQAGGRYVVAAKLVNAKTADVLASYRETAADSSKILDAVDRLSRKLRDRMGESLKLIRADRRLETVSTPSLEALLKYTRAVNAIDVESDYETGISLLEEALAIDSMFAMAWRKLAVVYANTGRGRDPELKAMRKAYDYRDRLTDAERYETVGYYYHELRDWKKAINSYELLREHDPNWPPNNLGIMYLEIRDYAKAREVFEEAIVRDSSLVVAWTNLIDAHLQQGQVDTAAAIAAKMAQRFGDNPNIAAAQSRIAYARGDIAEAAAAFRRISEAPRSSDLWRARSHGLSAALALRRGNLAEEARERTHAATLHAKRGVVEAPFSAALAGVRVDLLVRRDPARAKRTLEKALSDYPLDQFPILNRPYGLVARLLADVGDLAAARTTVAEWERNVAPELRDNPRRPSLFLSAGSLVYRVQAAIARAENRHVDALSVLRRGAEEGQCRMCFETELAAVFDQAAQPDSAIQHYEAFLNTPAPYRLFDDAFELGPVYERLAELYDQKNDRDKAAYYAAKFVELWENADSELQPRVQSKRIMLQRLTGEQRR